MSMREDLLALRLPLPTLARLAESFADLGGVEGAWGDVLGVGTSHVESCGADPELESKLAGALSRAGRAPLGEHALFLISGSDDADEVGERLVDLSGGAFISEEGELLHVRARPSRSGGATKRQALDVSLPPEVEHAFLKPRTQVCLYPRKPPTVRVPALVKALGEGTASYPKQAGTTHLVVALGAVQLNEYAEVDFYAKEFEQLGLPAPRTTLEAWHVDSMPEWGSRGMIALLCGLGRSADGVLYRPGVARFDFTLPAGSEFAPVAGRAVASAEDTAAAGALLARAQIERGDALAETLETLARLRWSAALETLDFEELCSRTDRAVVRSVWDHLERSR